MNSVEGEDGITDEDYSMPSDADNAEDLDTSAISEDLTSEDDIHDDNEDVFTISDESDDKEDPALDQENKYTEDNFVKLDSKTEMIDSEKVKEVFEKDKLEDESEMREQDSSSQSSILSRSSICSQYSQDRLNSDISIISTDTICNSTLNISGIVEIDDDAVDYVPSTGNPGTGNTTSYNANYGKV